MDRSENEKRYCRWQKTENGVEGIFRPSERVCIWVGSGGVLGDKNVKFAMFNFENLDAFDCLHK